MQLVVNLQRFDVMVLPNLYGYIVSDLCAGLIAGVGRRAERQHPGQSAAIFASVHGTAPDIAGQGKAIRTALLLSACMMLRHLGEIDLAGRIEQACHDVIASKQHVTFDLGGTATTSEFTRSHHRTAVPSSFGSVLQFIGLPIPLHFKRTDRRFRSSRLLVRSTISRTSNSQERVPFLAYLPISVASLMM